MARKCGVFISYSHEDAPYVSPITQLVRTVRKDLVFKDTDNLLSGEKWEPQLMKALEEAKMVILFWCRHSAKSGFVKKEYKTAMKNKKDVLPLLLDNTRLPKTLASYQWIDFRNFNLHQKTPRKSSETGSWPNIVTKFSGKKQSTVTGATVKGVIALPDGVSGRIIKRVGPTGGGGDFGNYYSLHEATNTLISELNKRIPPPKPTKKIPVYNAKNYSSIMKDLIQSPTHEIKKKNIKRSTKKPSRKN